MGGRNQSERRRLERSTGRWDESDSSDRSKAEMIASPWRSRSEGWAQECRIQLPMALFAMRFAISASAREPATNVAAKKMACRQKAEEARSGGRTSSPS